MNILKEDTCALKCGRGFGGCCGGTIMIIMFSVYYSILNETETKTNMDKLKLISDCHTFIIVQ